MVLQRKLRLANDADLTTVHAVCTDGLLQMTVKKFQPIAPVFVWVQAFEPILTDTDDSSAKRPCEFIKSLPGISAHEVTVSLEPRGNPGSTPHSYQLVVYAASSNGCVEYHFSHLLPDDTNPEGASAWCSGSQLHVLVPRREPVQVPVRDGDAGDCCFTNDEDDEELMQFAQCRVPDHSSEDVKIEATPGCLRVRFQKKGSVGMERLVVLPDSLDLGGVRAVCKDGWLTVNFAKSALRQTQPRLVPVCTMVPVRDGDAGNCDDDEDVLQFAQCRVPGYSAEDVKIEASPGCLHVTFQKKGSVVMQRLVVLPDALDLGGVRAVCKDGLLTLKIAKSALK
jgi:HSP20 family molecular chaperone IbpA